MGCLADPTRLRLVRLLERQELGVVDLCDVLQCPQSTVSRHLKVLADQGWTRSHRAGTTNIYRTAFDELDPAALRLWQLARDQTEGWATVEQDQLRLKRRLSQRRKDAPDFFAGAAGQWDKLRGELYGQLFTQQALLALLPSDYVIADLGCGTAQVASNLAGHVKKVIGVDQSSAMLKAAKKRTAGMKNVDLRKGELESIPIDTSTCDAVLILLVLTYLDDAMTTLREVKRILKRGGKVVIVDLLRHDRDEFRRQLGQQTMGYETKEIENMLREAELVKPNARPLPPEPEAKGPALLLATAEKK